MKNIKNYAVIKIKKNESVTNEPVLFTKREVLLFLKKQECPMDQIKGINWESCEYDDHNIEFHNPEDMSECILLHMKNNDIQSVMIHIDSNFQLSGISNQKVSFI